MAMTNGTDIGRDVPAGGPRGRLGVSATVIAHYWTSGRKQASFADTVVATIDHQMLAALTSRHFMLRHLGLARQVVILDELHAADTWMQAYVERSLEWLARYGVPVVALSATLPPARRQALLAAYERGRIAASSGGAASDIGVTAPAVPDSDAYPLVTLLTGGTVTQTSAEPAAGRDVEVAWLTDDEESLRGVLAPVIDAGGCALIICNTVKRAVTRYRWLQAAWDEGVTLAHSRFVGRDRIAKDSGLRETFGPGENPDRAGRIVVATQVAEQSLDIDFDLLVTDLAPVDLVLQRIGRLHRHERAARPGPAATARCFIIGMARLPAADAPPELDRGGTFIYSAHLLLRSAALLLERIDKRLPLRLPDDVPRLVRECYGQGNVGPSCWGADMEAARQKFEKKAAKIAKDAATYRLRAPGESRLTLGILNANVGEAESDVGASKQVRQDDGGFEVILLVDAEDGLRLLDSFGDTRRIPTDVAPDRDTARLLARSMVRVPGWVTNRPNEVDAIFADLNQRYFPAWQRNSILGGQLVLTVDPEGDGRMGPFAVHYDTEIGLEVSYA